VHNLWNSLTAQIEVQKYCIDELERLAVLDGAGGRNAEEVGQLAAVGQPPGPHFSNVLQALLHCPAHISPVQK
jgi:hypothetical protein